jgi:hypothetical protein
MAQQHLPAAALLLLHLAATAAGSSSLNIDRGPETAARSDFSTDGGPDEPSPPTSDAVGGLFAARRWTGVWTGPPQRVPSSKSVDGPLLGDGEAGLVLGGSYNSHRSTDPAPVGPPRDLILGSPAAATGGTRSVVVSAFLSANTAWVLNKCDNHCGSSHRAGLGGVEFTLHRVAPPGRHFTLNFEQDMKVGSVSWSVLENSGPAPSPSPHPPAPPPVAGCSIIGDWLRQGGDNNVSHIRPATSTSSGGGPEFRWPNWDAACKPAPGLCHDGWRYCTGTVDNATGAIALGYHRFESAGSGGCRKTHSADGSTEWICEYHGHFVGDCDHMQFPTAGKWHRVGSKPPSPPLPPAPAPVPAPAVPKNLFMSGTIILAQQSVGRGASKFITTLQLHSAAKGPAIIGVRTWAFGDTSKNQSGISNSGVGWARRVLSGSDTTVTGVIASRVLEPASATIPIAVGTASVAQNVTIPAPAANSSGGRSVFLAHVLLTSYTTGSDPLPSAIAATAAATNGSASAVARQASAYWAEFWNQSSVSLPSRPHLEEYWYKAQYLMAMASRSGRVAPGLWGPWVSTDSPAWSGGYTLDYNFEMPFQGLYSSNHADIADSYYPQVVAYAVRNGGNDAQEAKCIRPGGVNGLPGAVHFAVQLAPGGIKNYKNSLGINTNAAFASLNFISAFEFSQNISFLQTVSYPLLRAVAAYWNCSLQLNATTGHWDDIECTREGCYNGPGNGHEVDRNPAIAIGFIRRVLSHLVDVTGRGLVHPPATELAGWKDVLARLAPIPVGSAPGSAGGIVPVLLPQEWPIYTFPAEAHDNPLEFYGIWPSEQIGLSSPPSLLLAAQNTVVLANTTDPLQGNGFQEIFPAMVRVGINATLILDQLSDVIATHMPPNGYLQQGGGGIETAGATVAINDCLLHSWEGFLRFFPVWPSHEDASFSSLRAVGAFLVSAQLVGGKVRSGVVIKSEVGHACVVLSPWRSVSDGGNAPTISVTNRATGVAERVTGVSVGHTSGLWKFLTQPGATYLLSEAPGHS